MRRVLDWRPILIRHGKREKVREPSLRIVRSIRQDGVHTSKADRIKRFVLLLVAVVATALFGGACQSQDVGEIDLKLV
jgi:hypothetical protein